MNPGFRAECTRQSTCPAARGGAAHELDVRDTRGVARLRPTGQRARPAMQSEYAC
jgi:hypothetical protein